MNGLFCRFKRIYEKNTNYKVSWSKVDKNNNLTVGIVDSQGKELF